MGYWRYFAWKTKWADMVSYRFLWGFAVIEKYKYSHILFNKKHGSRTFGFYREPTLIFGFVYSGRIDIMLLKPEYARRGRLARSLIHNK
jgi:hypothetical protein